MRNSAACAVAFAIAVTSTPPALAAKPTRIEPKPLKGKERREARRERDESQGGTETGTFEFVLASVAAVITGAVIGRGAWELTQIDELREDCANGSADLDCGTFNVGRGNRIAAGLSFGFAVPMAVATGFLFARGARTRRDNKAWHEQHREVSLRPSASRRGGGLALQLRF
ncbi:MAG: hypothetical protein KUG77_27135 [Nannocystaceae bacterium]|nr:hypothetical protein [Nannocystaceae bacterium]